MITAKKAASAVGGKTARACDSCLRSRARWYCPADDAFLCQSCDSLVHSANQLAGRHERVRLETASNKPTHELGFLNSSPPSWHKGFTRKARTPRPARPTSAPAPEPDKNFTNDNPLCIVPEIGGSSEEGSPDVNEEEQVPVFDPFLGLFDEGGNCDGFLPSDMDLTEFAADVESLLGIGLDEDSCGIEGLGLVECREEDNNNHKMEICIDEMRVKMEDEELEVGQELEEGGRDGFDWNFDYESPVTGEEELEEKKVSTVVAPEEEKRKKICLRLNYEEVISAWSRQGGSPWTTGIKPELFSPDLCFPDFMGTFPSSNGPYGSEGTRRGGGGGGDGDGGREARVLRYREKRRTRLFSKKIRYEVRKLNAEKRPRMKGRFVKRTSSFPSLDFPHFLINK